MFVLHERIVSSEVGRLSDVAQVCFMSICSWAGRANEVFKRGECSGLKSLIADPAGVVAVVFVC